jgi:hypothetical protein
LGCTGNDLGSVPDGTQREEVFDCRIHA